MNEIDGIDDWSDDVVDKVKGEFELIDDEYKEEEFVRPNEEDDEVNELEAQLLDICEDVRLGDIEALELKNKIEVADFFEVESPDVLLIVVSISDVEISLKDFMVVVLQVDGLLAAVISTQSDEEFGDEVVNA